MLTLLILVVLSCKKDKDDEIDRSIFQTQKDEIKTNQKISSGYKLEMPYKKLEIFLGKDFIPVSSFKTNIDNDADEEFVIAYKKNENSKIFFCIFDLIKNEILKKNFEFETEIYHTDGFLTQTQNLFQKNNTGVVIEGKSQENIYQLYIIIFYQDNYEVVGNFVADFSIIVDYEEIDDEKGKFTKLKNVTTISNDASSLNTNVRKKDIFEWDENSFSFKVIKSEEFLPSSTIFSDPNIFYSETTYFNYIRGVWYPEKYKDIILNNSYSGEITEAGIRYIFFSDSPNEVGIKYDDYIDKYIITKIVKVWNQKPGLRLVIKEFNNPSEINYTNSIDLTLIEANLLKVQGPRRFDSENYVRLSKPFGDFITEKREHLTKSKISDVERFLKNRFISKDEIILEFLDNKKFQLTKGKESNIGVYQISIDKNDLIITFLSENGNIVLNNTNFIIKLYVDSNYFSLIPIKFEFDKVIVQELSSIDFYKK